MRDKRPPSVRLLAPHERQLLEFLLREPFPGSAALREQLDTVRVCRDYGPHDPTMDFCFEQPPPRLADVTGRVPVEAESREEDGAKVHVLLHVVNGLLDQLEFYREDQQGLTPPHPSELRLLCLDTGAGYPPER